MPAILPNFTRASFQLEFTVAPDFISTASRDMPFSMSKST